MQFFERDDGLGCDLTCSARPTKRRIFVWEIGALSTDVQGYPIGKEVLEMTLLLDLAVEVQQLNHLSNACTSAVG